MIEAIQVSYAVGDVTLLSEVSIEVRPGELVAVVGANGAGKSTLFKLLCRDLSPSDGEISLDGHGLGELSVIDQAKRRAVLPQSSTLRFPFTTLEVALMGRFPHLNGREQLIDFAIARAALSLTGVEDLEGRIYQTLSGGEQQRAQLARVSAQIWHPPPGGNRYLLLDEPTSSLDLSHQHRLLAAARRFVDEGTGALVVLHDLNLASQYADRVTVLKRGEQLQTGDPGEVITAELVEEAFDFRVQIVEHPILGCPLIIPLPERDGVSRKGEPTLV